MNENKPLVSFIITYYNLPVKMLCECIDSILQLSLSPSEREIIVVDDGSEISAMNELMKYGDDIVYVRQKNGGVSVARNTGLEMAQGSYIQFVDGDDQLIQAPYEQCLDIIRKHPLADIVLFDFTQVSHENLVPTDDISPMSGTELMKNHNIRGSVCGCLFRQAVRETLKFTPGIEYGEDEEFTSQLILRAETVYPTDFKAYYYRKYENSVTHQKEEERIQKRLTDSLTVIKHLNIQADRLPHTDRLALKRRVAQLTMNCIYNTIMLTRSSKQLEQLIRTLKAEGLFPLPDQNYTKKYVWFRKMTNTRLGRTILLHTLPMLKKER